MNSQSSAGARFRAALAAEKPLQVIGAINANHALLAKRAGYRAIYLSGGGVAAGSLGLPDLGINTADLHSGESILGVPEPTTWALMIMGFGGAGAMLRSRGKRDMIAA